MSTLPIADIRRESELQCRARGINKGTVDEYAELYKIGTVLPPIVVFKDAKGVHWLADGFHRVAAAELTGVAEIAVDVREGDRRAALLYAAGANASHGLRRTNADKRRAVLAVLAAFPKMTDRKIGEACGVDNKTVAAARRSLKPREEIPQSGAGEQASREAPTDVIPDFDLIDLYLEIARAHESRSIDEHWQAFESALALVFLRGPKRRRIVQPAGAEPAAANGGE